MTLFNDDTWAYLAHKVFEDDYNFQFTSKPAIISPKSKFRVDTETGTLFGEFELPGYKKDELEITREANLLCIATVEETSRKPVNQQYNIPIRFDMAKMTAKLEDGILRIEIPVKPENILAKVEIQ